MSDPIPHYIGVTGIQTPADVVPLATAAAAAKIGPTYTHNLMLGALVSPSTVHNASPTHTTKPHRHVSNRETLVEILKEIARHNLVGMIHCELHKSWPGTPRDRDDVLELLGYLANHGLRPPIQLNGVLVPEDIVSIHQEGGVPVVLQLRKELAERDRPELLDYIAAVSTAVSTILMDPSAGAGSIISLTPALSLMGEIERRCPSTFRFGFAGGLGGAEAAQLEATSALARELSRAIPGGAFSVDVETNVRAPAPGTSGDTLDARLCSLYFQAVRAGLDG